MKKLILFIFFCLTKVAFSQSFPYEISWGTYVGGTGTLLDDQGRPGTALFSDSPNNIYLTGLTYFQGSLGNAYYNQFTLNGNQANTSWQTGFYSTKFSPMGQMLKGSYDGSLGAFPYSRLIGIDNSDNQYFINGFNSIVNNLSTSGVWLTQPTDLGSSFTVTLSKYDANHNLLWTTYLPNNTSQWFALRFDENDNIFLSGDTDEEITGVGSTGVFQEHFISYFINNSQMGNDYIVKLNSSGQKIWGTYAVVGVMDLEYYDNNLYFVGNYKPQVPGSFATPGAFQTTVGNQVVIKLNASNGTEVWGTYYGSPIFNQYIGLGVSDIAVNETGLYLCGFTEDTSNDTYYATTGAFKTQLTGGGDMFLSKFSHDGNRVWSTYFGSDGYESWLAPSCLTILGNRIIFSGNQFGSVNNISTPGAHLTTIPNASNSSMFFTEFDSLGNRKWTSYFGGPANQLYGEYIHPYLLNDGSLVLWGGTGSSTGITTENAAFPTMLNPVPQQPFGFLAKFNLKNPELSTSEVDKSENLTLYDNPNNGVFTIAGDVLTKKNFNLIIYDLSGRLLFTEKMSKDQKQTFNYHGKLATGNYSLKVSSGKDFSKTFKMMVK